MTTTFLSFRHVSPIKSFEDRRRRNPVFLNMDTRLISSGMTAIIQHTHKHPEPVEGRDKYNIKLMIRMKL